MDMLENHPIFKAAMSKVDTGQRDYIRKVMDGHLERATEQMLPLLKKLDEDPELAARVRDKMRSDAGLDEVVNSEGSSTGSKVD